ncbi:MAG TPA: TIGR04086 family membrane protein [Acidimicrobiales bacterium]|nr:TIGR04086 family membrane protein [Acidimicrobiales bacterium]
MERHAPRPSKEHREVAREAGVGQVSLVSIIAGVVTAYGTFAVVAAVVGALLAAADVDTEFRTDDWTSSGAGASLASAVALFVAYLFGGYVAGRMARRAGLLHGAAVVVLSLIIGAVVGAVVSLGDSSAIEDNLRSIGVPTTTDQIEDVAVAGALLSLLGLVVGGLLGGVLGERWHTKLARRFADPEIGPAAEARAEADRLDRERDGRFDDAVLRHDAGTERVRATAVDSDAPAAGRDDAARGDVGQDGPPVINPEPPSPRR